MSFLRREQILDIFRKEKTVMLKDLCEKFPDVSSMTLRRDIKFFNNVGKVEIIRGGAKYIENSENVGETVYGFRAIKNHDKKTKISKIALKYLESGRSVFLDSGSTAMTLARIIPDVKFDVITAAPNVAIELSKRYKTNVTIIGGMLNPGTLAVSGPQSNAFVDSYNFDTAIMVASAFSPENGFTCGNLNDCELKKLIIKKAKQVIIMVDDSKFEKSMPYTFATMQDVDVFVTNAEPSRKILESANKNNTKVEWTLR